MSRPTLLKVSSKKYNQIFMQKLPKRQVTLKTADLHFDHLTFKHDV